MKKMSYQSWHSVAVLWTGGGIKCERLSCVGNCLHGAMSIDVDNSSGYESRGNIYCDYRGTSARDGHWEKQNAVLNKTNKQASKKRNW